MCEREETRDRRGSTPTDCSRKRWERRRESGRRCSGRRQKRLGRLGGVCERVCEGVCEGVNEGMCEGCIALKHMMSHCGGEQ